jgi:RDD family
MDQKKIYQAVAVVFAVTYGYNLFWFFKSLAGFGTYDFSPTFFLKYTIRYVPVFLGIAGLIIFISSKFKRSNLLRVIMCVEIMSFPFLTFWYIQFFTKTYGPHNESPALNWTFYAGCIINLSLLVTSIIGLRNLSLNKTASLTYIDYGTERVGQFSPASAGQRFVNRLVDGVMIMYVLLVNLDSITIFSNSESNLEFVFVIMLEIPFLIFYYLVLEGVFNTTAGKCATSTTIVNELGIRPGFAQILGRTFCRLIPFEPFSFVGAGARGWHDSLTNTYVTACVNKDDAEMNEITLDAELQNLQS